MVNEEMQPLILNIPNIKKQYVQLIENDSSKLTKMLTHRDGSNVLKYKLKKDETRKLETKFPIELNNFVTESDYLFIIDSLNNLLSGTPYDNKISFIPKDQISLKIDSINSTISLRGIKVELKDFKGRYSKILKYSIIIPISFSIADIDTFISPSNDSQQSTDTGYNLVYDKIKLKRQFINQDKQMSVIEEKPKSSIINSLMDTEYNEVVATIIKEFKTENRFVIFSIIMDVIAGINGILCSTNFFGQVGDTKLRLIGSGVSISVIFIITVINITFSAYQDDKLLKIITELQSKYSNRNIVILKKTNLEYQFYHPISYIDNICPIHQTRT